MKRLALLIAAGALTLSACTAPPATPAGPATATAPATVPGSPAAKTDQGFIAKKVGEQAGLTNPDGSAAVDFWITKITVDPKCGPYMKRDSGKHTLLLDITVQTHTAADESTFPGLPGLINPFTFQTKGEDGVSNQAEAGLCTTTPKALPSSYAANSKYTGQIEIQTANPHGSLLLAAQSMVTGTNGWEWAY